MNEIAIITTGLRRLLLMLILFGWCDAGLVLADDLVILKGSSASVDASAGIKRMTVSDPKIIDTRLSEDGQSAIVTGISEGTSELRIELLTGPNILTNVVVRSDLSQMVSEVKDLLSDVDGLTIQVVGNKIVVKGNVLTISDYDKVTKVVAAYSGVMLNLATFDRSGMNKFVEEAVLKDIGLDTITAHVMGDQVILEGTTYSQADADRAVEVAKLRVPNVKSLLRIQDVMIETDVEFVQLSSDANTDFGYNVLDSLGVSAVGNAFGASGMGGKIPISFGVSATASAQLKALLGSGRGKMVAQPHLSTKSGDVGTFQSGATTYFSVPSTVGPSTLQSVDYGVILKVKPVMQGRDQIMNEISIEVSIPVPSASGVLTLQKYDTTCTSVCKIGESTVMSGMVQTIMSKNSSKTPGLGDIPLVSLFFSNRTSDKSRNEFVILVTPQPVLSTTAAGLPFGQTHQALLQDKNSKE